MPTLRAISEALPKKGSTRRATNCMVATIPGIMQIRTYTVTMTPVKSTPKSKQNNSAADPDSGIH